MTQQHSTFTPVPLELRELNQWIVWKYVGDDRRKVPFNATTGKAAKSNDVATWTTFGRAAAKCNGTFQPGFMFAADDPFTGIDLDGCRNPETGEILDWGRRILDRLNSYSEISPSGTGVKVWVRGSLRGRTGKKRELPDMPRLTGGDKMPAVEMYDRGRYFAVTGQRLAEYPETIQERQDVVDELLARFWPEPHSQRQPERVSRQSDVLERARKYVGKIPPAIAGSGGDKTTFHVACVLVLGFDLSEHDAMSVLADFNQRCKPPWTDRDLQRKIASAMEQPGERGYLLSDTRHHDDRVTVGGTPERSRPEPAETMPVVVAPWQPFPVDCLPNVLSTFIRESAGAIDCDPAFVALPLLGMVAGAIGGTRRLLLKRGWAEPVACWSCIVSPSGTAKSVAWRAAVTPIFRHHHQQIEAYRAALAVHAADLLIYDCDVADWKAKRKKGGAGDPAPKPTPPPETRYMIDDPTLQKMVPLLGQNPRGLLLLPSSGELGAWLGDFNRWSGEGGVSSDALRWTATFHGDSITCDRVTGGVRYVPHAYVSVAGNIQPETLRAALGQEHLHNGLAARLLLAMPPRAPKRITDAEVSAATEAAYVRLIDSLLELQPTPDNEMKPQPMYLGLRPDAKREMVKFLNDHNEQLSELDNAHERASWSKLEAYSIRFALLIHLVRAKSGNVVECDPVDVESVRAAITLTEWFRHESQRVYAWLSGALVTDHNERLVAWIRQRGGSVTIRDLQKGPRRFRDSSETAEAALQALVDAQLGSWVNQSADPQGGWPIREFRLSPPATATLGHNSG
jgi:hypothetical protein